MPQAVDPFFEPYDRQEIAYGDMPSAALLAFLEQATQQELDVRPRAIDLGAGAGRDTIALAKAGYDVLAVDLSERGLERVVQRAADVGLQDRVNTLECDVREVEIEKGAYDAIIGTTVLDHIPREDSIALWKRMLAGLSQRGMMYVQVHTTEDPGSDQSPGRESDAPVSETAAAVINYFLPNQLASWAAAPESEIRILRYEERLEWDYTHGPEHLHGKAVLLAVKAGFHPAWYGQPIAFPRRQN